MTTPNLRAMGIALCAALALGATAAASASAETFTNNAADGIAHLTAEADPEGGGSQDFETTTGESKVVKCSEVQISGTAENGAEELTVEPTYGNCGIWETREPEVTEKVAGATIDTEGCHYLFTGETTFGNPTDGFLHAALHVLNASGLCDHIRINVTSFQVNCMDIPAQEIAATVRYHNILEINNKRALTLAFTAHGIKSTTTNNNIFCPTETGGTVVHENGSYTGNLIVRGYEDEAHEAQVDLKYE